MAALAEKYEHGCAGDDSQYSSLALLCMMENLLPFSQQLLQIAIAPEPPTGALVCFFSHQDVNRLAHLFCASHAIQCSFLRPPFSFVYDATLLSSPALVFLFLSVTEFSVFQVLSICLPG